MIKTQQTPQANNGDNHPIWLPAQFKTLTSRSQTSNQVLTKNDDGVLSGMRYVITPEPSTLRPIKSWTINIEAWECDDVGNISADDILFVRLLNSDLQASLQAYDDMIKDVVVYNRKLPNRTQKGFNALMAAMLCISKIDAGRLPDTDKTLSIYNLIS